jgi:hypothetical protein
MIPPIDLHHFAAPGKNKEIVLLEDKVNEVVDKMNLLHTSQKKGKVSSEAMHHLAEMEKTATKLFGHLDPQTAEKISTVIATKLTEIISSSFSIPKDKKIIDLKSKLEEEARLFIERAIDSLEEQLAS